ncbi:predicted protein [Streptomyces viridosporus ATCC 14672]|uniref:Predicted protein n=1 Tax=Streptomyces viridosporus (strain ATCC 14672 / DSM 40746 / JCM 4963 / KCTC 9882 / NRRL B-12104 / FH 1290) TaxID=566461 RepID=D5ZSW4_STRV1|nr:predicted protein [Streptomyces viridosporus ATCC 14672]
MLVTSLYVFFLYFFFIFLFLFLYFSLLSYESSSFSMLFISMTSVIGVSFSTAPHHYCKSAVLCYD